MAKLTVAIFERGLTCTLLPWPTRSALRSATLGTSCMTLPVARKNCAMVRHDVFMVVGDPWATDDDPDEPLGDTPEGLSRLLDLQLSLLIAVATGGPRIDDVNEQYKERRRKLNSGLKRLGLSAPFPWLDLWGWYGYWSANFSTYGERRAYVRELARPVTEQLEHIIDARPVDDAGTVGPGWPDLEARLTEVKTRLNTANSLDDLQDVGRRTREIIIDLGQIAYTSDMLGEGEEEPQHANAKLMLTYAARALMPGRAHEEWRTLIRAAWDLPTRSPTPKGYRRLTLSLQSKTAVMLVRSFEAAIAEPGRS